MTTNRNFNDLYAFTQVVKLGNFSRAAQSLGVQRSALSHRINDLENRLNTKLLNRTTRSMSPTEAGQRLYERIAPIVWRHSGGAGGVGRFARQSVGQAAD